MSDAGRAPRNRFQYALARGQRDSFLLLQELSLLDVQHPIGTVTLELPLQVHVLGVVGQRFTLSLKLGPSKVSRSGNTSGIELAKHVERARSGKTVALDVVVDARGHLLAPANLSAAKLGGLGPMLETVVSVAHLPGGDLGMGARWQSRLENAGGVVTESQHELVAMHGHQATLRIWRTQSSPGPEPRTTRSMGEWVLDAQHWPMTGADRIVVSVPHAEPRRISAVFKIQRRGSH